MFTSVPAIHAPRDKYSSVTGTDAVRKNWVLCAPRFRMYCSV